MEKIGVDGSGGGGGGAGGRSNGGNGLVGGAQQGEAGRKALQARLVMRPTVQKAAKRKLPGK